MFLVANWEGGIVLTSDPSNTHFAELLFWWDSFGHVFIYPGARHCCPSSFCRNTDLFEKPEMSPQGIIEHSAGIPRSLKHCCVSLIPYLAHGLQMISHIKPTGEEVAVYLLKAGVCQFYLQTNEQKFHLRKIYISVQLWYSLIKKIWSSSLNLKQEISKRQKPQTNSPPLKVVWIFSNKITFLVEGKEKCRA